MATELKIVTKPQAMTGPKARRKAAVKKTSAISSKMIDEVFEIRHNVLDAKEGSRLYEQLVALVKKDSGGVEAKLKPMFNQKNRVEHRLKSYYSKDKDTYSYSKTLQWMARCH
jgi:hypothetical protein